LTRSRSLDNEQRNELEAIIHDLEDENRLLQHEYERLCQQHMEKSLIINEQSYTSESQLGSSSLINEYNMADREMLREAKQLRHHENSRRT
jgi:ribosomal protein L16 Arg81 hydroxylase